MLTLNLILKEIKDIPVERLEEVYEYVHSIAVNSKEPKKKKKTALDFAGAWSDMKEEDYQDFINHTKKVRKELFNRKFDI